MTHKDLEKRGLKPYTIRRLRSTQKRMPSYNEIIYNASSDEFISYDLGYLTDEDILIQFENQDDVLDLNDFIKERIKNIEAEVKTVELSGHTLNFIKSLPDYEAALNEYTREQILSMSRGERIAALRAKYTEIFGVTIGYDEYQMIEAIKSAT